MFSKAIALFALIAGVYSGAVPAYQSTYAAQPFAVAGPATYVQDSPHVGFQSEQTVRGGFGSSVSHQQKGIDSAFSSVRKTDTRITNPALSVAHTYAAPVQQVAYAHQQPIAYAQPAPVAYKSAVYAQPAPVAYKSAVYSAAAPAVAAAPAYAQYAAPAVAAPAVYKAAAPVAYAAPAVAKVASPALLGVQYSAVSPAVATLNFNGYGISYGY